MSAHVIVRHLTKRYGPHPALHDVSLTLARGEIFGLLGPNGAGKTTLLECLVGLRSPDSGHITIAEIDARTHSPAARAKIGVVLQTPTLPERITPREALRLFAAFYSAPAPTEPLLARFGLTACADQFTETLSGGLQQRLALALAFVNQPDLVVLDEPTTGLDPHARAEIRAEILRLKTEGRTVLLATHELAEAEQLCDRVAILAAGQVRALGSPGELKHRFAAHLAVTLVTTPPLTRAQLLELTGDATATLTGDTATWTTPEATATLARIATSLPALAVRLVDLQVRPASLERIFLQLTPPSADTCATHDEEAAR